MYVQIKALAARRVDAPRAQSETVVLNETHVLRLHFEK